MKARVIVEDGGKDEVKSWLERVQWLPYLVDSSWDELLAAIEGPNTDPNIEEAPIVAAIWEGMDDVVRIS